jgi:hypothetical protein
MILFVIVIVTLPSHRQGHVAISGQKVLMIPKDAVFLSIVFVIETSSEILTILRQSRHPRSP